MKIIIALLVTISLGIVVGSNLTPVMTIVIFNQPTIGLPIGVWLSIALGLGLLSSSLIQLAIFVDHRRLRRQIRQLQTRLQQSDEDIFAYTSQESATNKSSSEPPSRFSSYRSKFGIGAPSAQKREERPENITPSVATAREKQFSNQQSAKSTPRDLDDWDVEPIINRQLDWEDGILPQQQNSQAQTNNSTSKNKQNQREPELTSREVYDADFRLIQPPYKQPIEIEFEDDRESSDFEYTEIDEEDDRDFEVSSSSVQPSTLNRSTSGRISEDEDWGFDFEDTSVRRN
jgi:hypothetical protein